MQAALKDFQNRVNSIERTIILREDLIEFGQVSPRHLLNPSVKRFRQSVRHTGLAGMQPILDGSILLIVGAFEQFISDVIVAFTMALPTVVPAYEDLPRAIQSANERYTGEALARRNSYMFDDYDLRRFTRNLAGCHAGVRPYVLNGEAMALNNRNLTVSTLRGMMVRLGVQDIWTAIGSTRVLQTWSGPGGAKVATSRLQTEHNQMISSRNDIAHRVGGAAVGPQVILSYVKCERALARSLAKVLENYIGTL